PSSVPTTKPTCRYEAKRTIGRVQRYGLFFQILELALTHLLGTKKILADQISASDFGVYFNQLIHQPVKMYDAP
ncbi:MAG: hypothetical protein KJO34_06810, partial [Deltaproteobacteria bacterium]|nr:hypothetical protein [Deltaproteobacteria bacterium]